MLCQNCNQKEASVKFTHIVNGVKKEMMLCENCSEKLGIGNFNIPINFTSFFGDFLGNYGEELLPGYKEEARTCKTCGMSYDEFIEAGKFGCSDCYAAFSDKINPVLKKLHGSDRYVGKSPSSKGSVNTVSNVKKPRQTKENKLNQLKQNLKMAIEEENYEQAAMIRDEIKKYEK